MKSVLICIMMLTAFAGSSSAQQTLDNSEVNSLWRTKKLSVKNGGQTPDVVTLLRAFYQAMPTWAVSQVLKQADHPAKGTRQSGTAAIWDGEEEGMNNGADFYSYRAQSTDYDYQDGAGPFDTAIRFSVGMEPIQGGDDDKVIKACDACYEELKHRPNRREGKVLVFKIRHPDGKQKVLKEYEF